MIIIEFLLRLIYYIFYLLARPVIWLITARDCRHCKYGGCNHQGTAYCRRDYCVEEDCKEVPWRRNFERKGYFCK